MNKKNTYSIKVLAQLSSVTVRTLHYYDEINLLVPERGHNGYRVYNHDHVLRLQQILVHREMGLSLEEIRKVLGNENFDYPTALREQREQLLQRTAHISKMVKAIDAALDTLSKNNNVTKDNAMTMFNGFEHSDHEVETKKKWGDTAQYQESARRLATYGPDKINMIKEEEAAWLERLKGCFLNKLAPGSDAALELAEEQRLHINRWFYPCSHAMHKNLGELYINDEKFKSHYENKASGLTQFLYESIHANALKRL